MPSNLTLSSHVSSKFCIFIVGPLAWHFCTEKNCKKIEKVQERALRFVYEDYHSSYDNLLKKAKVPSLQIRRMRTMALETFKIMNKLSP
jgi:hypothetical protein